MSKMTKKMVKEHERVCNLLAVDRNLTKEEVEQVIVWWDPRYSAGSISKSAAFFTPWDIAQALVMMTCGSHGRILDLCAGIGSLIWAVKAHNGWNWDNVDEVVAVELNPEYVAVGQKLFPEVRWIQGSMLDQTLWRRLGKFDITYSNPPFGKVLTTHNTDRNIPDTDWLEYQGPAHLMAVEIAMRVTKLACGFILPQTDLPFTYSRDGSHSFKDPDRLSKNLQKFFQSFPEIKLESVAIDLEPYHWTEAPAVELVDVSNDGEPLSVSAVAAPQLSLFV